MIGNLFVRSSKVHGTKPFIEFHKHGHNRTNTRDYITYQESYKIVQQYEHWVLDDVIQPMLLEEVDVSSSDTHTNCKETKNVEIVIAHLVHNIPDSLLSIFGSINMNRTVCHKNIKGKIRIALLNTRWSGKEIAQALSIRNGANDNDGHMCINYITCILHGNAMSKIAMEACTILNEKSNHECFARAIAIPSIASLPTETATRHNENQIIKSKFDHDKSYNMHDEAIILFTSGTTSGPKGVILSHLAMFVQAMAKSFHPCSYSHKTKMIASTVPFFHVAGINSALSIMMVGGCLVFPKQQQGFSFDPVSILDCIDCDNDKYEINSKNTSGDGVDTLVIVPAMLHAILDKIKKDGISFSGIRLVLVGGQNITIPQLQQSQSVFPNARIVQTFACTEAGSSITFRTLYDPSRGTMTLVTKPKKSSELMKSNITNGTCVGIAPPHVELAIFALKDDQPTFEVARPYQIGAIGTRGPHLMNGYWKRGSDKESIGIIDKWLICNDLGYMDDHGQLYFCGRLNDVIRTGGETVFAPEVEAIIIQHPRVDECAVFALPDERFGESVCAAIVLKSKPMSTDMFSLDTIRHFCEQKKLTGYKRPRQVFVLTTFPRTSSGKVMKNELKRICSNRSKL